MNIFLLLTGPTLIGPVVYLVCPEVEIQKTFLPSYFLLIQPRLLVSVVSDLGVSGHSVRYRS